MTDRRQQLVLLPFDGTGPRLSGVTARSGRAAVLGRVEAGEDLCVGEATLVRADGHFVRIGDDVWLGDYVTVHISHNLYPTIVGDRVTVGANAVIHACTVASDCVIGQDVVILDGSVVGEGVVVEPGAVVFPRSQLLRGGVYSGAPARRIAEVEPRERERLASEIRTGGGGPGATRPAGGRAGPAGNAGFVASTARLKGQVRAAPGSSIWFSCDLDAGSAEIRIGQGSNIQDNSTIRCTGPGVSIGARSVLGHNVAMEDCTVGTGALIGIGSRVAAGTVVQDNVLLAAGARTEPGQVLESGWVWGGSPARKLAPLDDRKTAMIGSTVANYVEYAGKFEEIEAEASKP